MPVRVELGERVASQFEIVVLRLVTMVEVLT